MIYEKIFHEFDGNVELVNIKATSDDGSIIYIPVDEGNVDYQAYLASLEENN